MPDKGPAETIDSSASSLRFSKRFGFDIPAFAVCLDVQPRWVANCLESCTTDVEPQVYACLLGRQLCCSTCRLGDIMGRLLSCYKAFALFGRAVQNFAASRLMCFDLLVVLACWNSITGLGHLTFPVWEHNTASHLRTSQGDLNYRIDLEREARGLHCKHVCRGYTMPALPT